MICAFGKMTTNPSNAALGVIYGFRSASWTFLKVPRASLWLRTAEMAEWQNRIIIAGKIEAEYELSTQFGNAENFGCLSMTLIKTELWNKFLSKPSSRRCYSLG